MCRSRAIRLLPVVLTAGATFALFSARAEGQSRLYSLHSPSQLEVGCFGPCDCAVRGFPMQGTFALMQVDDNGLYVTYSISNVDWKFISGAQVARLTGSGTYRVGGEVAVQHEIVLDLSMDGGPVRRFASGLVPGGGDFPKIDLDAALHGFACYDTVIAVHAAPTTTGSGNAAPLAAAIDLEPNPFRSWTRFDIQLPAEAHVELVLFDVRGRAVRHLAHQLPLGRGHHTFLWPGDRDDGTRAAGGVFFLRLDTGSRVILRRVVMLQ